MGARPHDSHGPWRNFYGRIKGKTMNKVQQVRLETQLKSLSPGPVGYEENPHRTPLDPSAIFGGKEIWLEIGFGGGEHIAHQAKNNPDVGFIGCEPFVNGVAMLLGKIEREDISNIRIYPGDVRDLFDVLPENSINKAFLLYPDPWPKKRHHRRRFVTPDHPLAIGEGDGGNLMNFALQQISKIMCAKRSKMFQSAGFDPAGDLQRGIKSGLIEISTRYRTKALRARTTLPELPAQWQSSSRNTSKAHGPSGRVELSDLNKTNKGSSNVRRHGAPIPMTSCKCTGLSGVVEVPGDKSISHRSLIFGAMAVGKTEISGLLEGQDVLDTAKAMEAFGASVTNHGDGNWTVHGGGGRFFQNADGVIDCGNSGTGVRLIMGAMATHDMTATFTGDASLNKRPMARVTDPIALFGAKAHGRKGGQFQ